MKFAENGYYNVGVSLSGCDRSAATRMRKDLEDIRQISDQLDAEVYPCQLSAVVAYLRRQLKLQLWLGEQEIRFAATGAMPRSDANGTPACRATAERASRERANGGCSVIGTWTHCILTSSARRTGHYPEARLKAFLNAKGIRILEWEDLYYTRNQSALSGFQTSNIVLRRLLRKASIHHLSGFLTITADFREVWTESFNTRPIR